MSDLDLGVIDRRTVIVAIIVFILADAFFHYPLPVRTNSFAALFVDIAMLVGYVYFARTLFRLPIALAIMVPRSFHAGVFIMDDWLPGHKTRDSHSKEPGIFDHLIRFIRQIIVGVLAIPLSIVLLLITASQFDYYGKWSVIHRTDQKSLWRRSILYTFRTIDRLGLVAILFLAAMPTNNTWVPGLGIIGLATMLVVYVFKGTFSYIIRDALEPETPEELPKVDLQNDRYRPIYVKVVTDVGPGQSEPVQVEVVNHSGHPINVKEVGPTYR